MDTSVDVEVNGRTYKVVMFNPMEAFNYLYKWSAATLNGMDYGPLIREALNRCIVPDVGRLSETSVFNEWFAKHPEDMVTLGHNAKEALCGPFEGKGSNTSESAPI